MDKTLRKHFGPLMLTHVMKTNGLRNTELEPYLHVKNPDGTDYDKEQKA